MPDDKAVGWRNGTHDPCSAELLGAPQRCLDIRDAHVEDGVTRIARSAAYASADSCPVFRSDQVQKPVVRRFRYFLSHGRGHVEFPTEELSEVLAKPNRILAYDLKVHDGLWHPASLAGGGRCAPHGPSCPQLAYECYCRYGPFLDSR